MSRAKRPALGRGLGALLPSKPAAPAPAAALPGPAAAIPTGGGQREVDIEQVTPNPDQPRKHFDPGALEELAASIRTQGILQPLVVSAAPAGDDGRPRYLIVAGERRWRAAQKAGLHRVPVVVKDVAANERLEVALIENIQRADLNPIEEARAYADLTRLRGYTQDELAARVGKDRSTVSNAMRLLRLPDKVQTLVVQGRLSMGHARALLGLTHEDEMHAVATDILRDNLSVRATEAAVRKAVRDRRATDEPGDDDEAERRKIIVAELENRLRRRLGARVRLRAQGSRGAGTVEIPYATLDELDRLLRILLGKHDAVE